MSVTNENPVNAVLRFGEEQDDQSPEDLSGKPINNDRDDECVDGEYATKFPETPNSDDAVTKDPMDLSDVPRDAHNVPELEHSIHTSDGDSANAVKLNRLPALECPLMAKGITVKYEEFQPNKQSVECVTGPVKIEIGGDHVGEVKIKEEEDLVGKVKLKPMASLVESTLPNPQPGMHPFFVGFDDHIRSLIMNRHPPFAMTSLMQRPRQFMYYDNSTNRNLKKMLNGPNAVAGHKPGRYVPINVPRPRWSQVPFRAGSSAQTPNTAPSTSYRWDPQRLTASVETVNSALSVPTFTPANPSPPTLPNSNTSDIPHDSNSNVPAPPVKVSSSSSTDDLENHSTGNNVIIKTEIDLGIDSKENVLETLNETDVTRSVDSPDGETSGKNLEIAKPFVTGDLVGPSKETLKRNTFYELPTYSTKGSLLCKCCDFRCNRRTKLKEHLETMHTEENFFKCFYCIKKNAAAFPHKTLHDLEHHVGKFHRGEKRWQCKYCSKSYKCRVSYKAHMKKTCSQAHPYACHMCTFTCETEAALEKHLKAHERCQETMTCPFCNKTYKRYSFKQHLINVHAPSEEKPFRCASCNFGASYQGRLDNHYKKTGHGNHLKCDTCEFTCGSESAMKNHMDGHNKEDKLVCGVDDCQLKCKNVRSLQLHRRLHSLSESEVFKCPDKDCPMMYTIEQSLRNHVAKTKHHLPFKCTDCWCRFLKEDSLNKHVQVVHVPLIVKKMEKPTTEPVVVRNVEDLYNYVEESELTDNTETYDEIGNFGCWLGISGFGDTDKTDCDNQETVFEDTNESNGFDKTMEEDEEYQNLVPITCLVEVKDETDDAEDFADNTNDNKTNFFVNKIEVEEAYDPKHSNQISCLVECQEKPSTSADPDENDSRGDCFSAHLVKLEVEEMDVS